MRGEEVINHMSNKWSEYQRGRQDGLLLAAKIVKEDGIEGLEKELQFRGATKINSGITRKELNNLSMQIKDKMLDAFLILGVASIYDTFGFGQKRCNKWVQKLNEAASYLSDDLAEWDDYINGIKNELGITLEWRN